MRWHRSLCWLIFPLLTSCAYFSDHAAAPVTELSAVTTNGIHIVQPGETLYEIAWKYGRDYRSLAQANQISAPFTIYPGQKLILQRFALANIKKPNQIRGSSKKAIAKISDQSSNNNTMSNKAIAQSAAPSKIGTITKTQLDPEKALGTQFNNQWDWPAKGKIINVFATHGLTPNKGIDIAGTMGAPVKSAGKGKVVYSGSGLRGYGQLLIIKHNDMFLSAYAHNSRLLVKEGDTVERGQVIAHMGQSEAQSVRLHFEIRKNGQPINPMTLLPRKSA